MAMKTETLQSVVARLGCGPSFDSLGRNWALAAPFRDLNPVPLLCGIGGTGFWRTGGARVES